MQKITKAIIPAAGVWHSLSASYQESAQGDAAGGGQAHHSIYCRRSCGKRH